MLTTTPPLHVDASAVDDGALHMDDGAVHEDNGAVHGDAGAVLQNVLFFCTETLKKTILSEKKRKYFKYMTKKNFICKTKKKKKILVVSAFKSFSDYL